MDERILTRTHYQADEPFYLALVVASGSPTSSVHRDSLASRVGADIRARGKEFNDDAARYLVDLARASDLLTASWVWTSKGHLLNLFTPSDGRPLSDLLPLNLKQKLLFLRLFLESDGAALLFIARKILKDRSFPVQDWNQHAQQMFESTFSAYLSLADRVEERVRLRQKLAKLIGHPYSGRTGSHKMFVHLQVLARIGLIERIERTASRKYDINDQQAVLLNRLIKKLPDISMLERFEGDWATMAADILTIGKRRSVDPDSVFRRIINFYSKVESTGVAVCPLSTIIEATQIELISDSGRLEYGEALAVLEKTQKRMPRDIRFHVNRQGKPAFVRISRPLVEATIEIQ